VDLAVTEAILVLVMVADLDLVLHVLIVADLIVDGKKTFLCFNAINKIYSTLTVLKYSTYVL